jgi:hypothetical protein
MGKLFFKKLYLGRNSSRPSYLSGPASPGQPNRPAHPGPTWPTPSPILPLQWRGGHLVGRSRRKAERRGRWPSGEERKLVWRPAASRERWAVHIENEVGPDGRTSQKGGSVRVRFKWSLSWMLSGFWPNES